MSLEGKLVEVAGKIIGMVVEDNEKTLLIREAHDDGKVIMLLEKAMYFEKPSVVDSYWVKIINPDRQVEELPVKPLNVHCNLF